MKELTRAEEEVMQILWKLEKAFVRDIIEEISGPKPAYNTVSTIVRILVKKGFVKYKAFGKTHQYSPTIPKSSYSKFYLDSFMSRYFGGSFENLVSFFAKHENLSLKEMDKLMSHVKHELDHAAGQVNNE